MVANFHPIRVGIAGFGYWGAHLARNVAGARGTDLVAIADPHPGRAETAGLQYPHARICSDVSSLAADPQIDSIILATPAGTHAELALEALHRGKHVLVEKPLSLTSNGARAIVEVSNRRGLTLMVGHTFLYAPAVQRLARLVREGTLGTIRHVNSQRLLGRARRDCDVLWDLAAHDISILMHVLGEVPSEVSGIGYQHMSLGRYDTCFAHLRFPSGADASLHVSWVNPYKVRLLTLVGTRQMAIYDDVPLDEKVTVYGAGLDDAERAAGLDDSAESEFSRLDLRHSAGDKFIPGLAPDEPLLAEVEAFASSCCSGATPLASSLFGLTVVLVLEAITESIASGGVRVPVPSAGPEPIAVVDAPLADGFGLELRC